MFTLLAPVHSFAVIHGDLTGVSHLCQIIWSSLHSVIQSNILITDEGKACLCDFGLSSITEFQGTSYLASTIGGNVRWTAPELFHINEDGSIPPVTSHSDIYSFGSVMLEVQLYSFSLLESPADVVLLQVLSGHVPYSYLLRDAQVIIEVHRGVKPRRPKTSLVTDQLWCFINSCWAEDPTDRPDIEEVSKSVEAFLRGNRRSTSWSLEFGKGEVSGKNGTRYNAYTYQPTANVRKNSPTQMNLVFVKGRNSIL